MVTTLQTHMATAKHAWSSAPAFSSKHPSPWEFQINDTDQRWGGKWNWDYECLSPQFWITEFLTAVKLSNNAVGVSTAACPQLLRHSVTRLSTSSSPLVNKIQTSNCPHFYHQRSISKLSLFCFHHENRVADWYILPQFCRRSVQHLCSVAPRQPATQ